MELWATIAPSTGPVGPGTVSPTALTVTCSKTMPGMFSVRYTSPTCGSPGMIMAGGPSTPARHVPSVSTGRPFLYVNASSPRYHTDPSSAWA